MYASITELQGAQAAQSLGSYSSQGRAQKAVQHRSGGDSVSISEAGRAAWQASQSHETVSGAEDKSLMDQLRKYIENPILEQTKDKIERAVKSKGYDPITEQTVLEEIMGVIRSGIPAKGEQTDDSMRTLSESLKQSTGLTEDEIADLTQKIHSLLVEAQEEEARAGKTPHTQQEKDQQISKLKL